MTAYTYLSIDAKTTEQGGVVDVLPLDDVSYFSTLSDRSGALKASIPASHPKATRTNLDPPMREIAVVRDGVVVWNGPIVRTEASKRDDKVQILAREAHWYLDKRTVEVDIRYANTDIFTIARDLVARSVTKTGGALYRFSLTAGLSGKTKSWDLAGRKRYIVGQVIRDLAADPTLGFDFRMSYAGSTARSVTRTLELGSPSLGVLTAQTFRPTPDPTSGMLDITSVVDLELAANRVHAVGETLVHSTGNAGSLAAGCPLYEEVLERRDVNAAPVLVSIATEYRRLAIPPVKHFTATYRPSPALPYGWAKLGDRAPLKIAGGYFAIDEQRRVVQIDVAVSEGGAEEISLTFNRPLDDLGA